MLLKLSKKIVCFELKIIIVTLKSRWTLPFNRNTASNKTGTDYTCPIGGSTMFCLVNNVYNVWGE